MVTKKPVPVPRTLTAAHDMLVQMRPGSAASADAWLKYYRRSAVVYAEVAEIDRGHHHEAMYWANRERAKASKLQAEIAEKFDPPVITTVTAEPHEAGPKTVHNEP